MDETLALPSEKAVKIALRTQQIIAHETGVVNTADPLGGSYFVEALTDRMEKEAERYFDAIDGLGGVIPAIEQGFFQREIAAAAYRYQLELDSGEKTIVGVNDFVEEDEVVDIPILTIPPEVEVRQKRRMAEVRAERSQLEASSALAELRTAAVGGKNLLPYLLGCTRAYVTLGEMCTELAGEYGIHEEESVF
jgi:methylmalonyl-CoA mutase N-terminal domain/subunit